MTLKLRFLIILTVCLFSSVTEKTTCQATPTIQLTPQTSNLEIGSYIAYYVDSKKEYQINDIASSGSKIPFVQNKGKVLNFGMIDAQIWIKIKIEPLLDKPEYRIVELGYPLLDNITLFLNAGNLITTERTGDLLPYTSRPVKNRNLVFKVLFQPGIEHTLYLKIISTSSLNFQIDIWTEDHFWEKEQSQQLVFGILFGLLGLIIIYNIILYFAFRDCSYLYYLSFVFAFLLIELNINGFSFVHFWPDSPVWANLSTPFFLSMTVICAAKFTKYFLDCKNNSPYLNHLLSVCILIAFFCIFLVFSYGYSVGIRWAIVDAIFFSVIAVTTATHCLIKGVKPARYFLIAWIAFLLGSIFYSLKVIGLLPHTIMTVYSLHIGVILQVVILSLALIDRIKIFQQERDQAQLKILVQERETRKSLMEGEKKILKLNAELESRVLTRTKQLNESNNQLEKACANLQQLDHLKTEFVSTISHELKTPLTAILGFGKIIQKKLKDHIVPFVKSETPKVNKSLSDVSHDIGIIIKESERLSNMINNVLDFSRFDAERANWHLEPLDVQKLIQQAFDSVSSIVDAKEIQVHINIDENLPKIIGDNSKIIQVLVNLLSNALKNTKSTISCFASMFDKENVLISVKDDGPGIKGENLKIVFEKFRQIKNSDGDKPDGSGLGLAICEDIIHKHFGKIWVENNDISGCTFSFTLPILK